MVQVLGLITLGLAVASLSASAGGVWASIRFANRMGWLDVPNERSSHTVPTPRTGGVPMVLAVALTFGCWTMLAGGEPLSIKGSFHTILFAVAMAVLGFWDDISGLSPLLRFLVQIAAAISLLWLVAARFPEIAITGESNSKVAGVVLGGIWVVWMLNLYNFMDGIDGLAGGEAAVASSFFLLVFAHYGETGWAVANLFIAAAALGFLIYNWPPAKVFMGDGGSAFLGAFYGMQSIIAFLTTPVPFSVLILPFANFIMDTTFTLFRRVAYGEKWYRAHRSHFYQRLTTLGMTHRKVTSIELSVVVASCVVAAGCIGADTTLQIALGGIVIAGLVGAGYWVVRKESLLPRERT